MKRKQKNPKNWDEKDKHDWQVALGQRLREAIKDEYGYRKEYQFAKDIDISQGSLSEIISGLSAPSGYTLIKIMRNSEIDIQFILRG